MELWGVSLGAGAHWKKLLSYYGHCEPRKFGNLYGKFLQTGLLYTLSDSIQLSPAFSPFPALIFLLLVSNLFYWYPSSNLMKLLLHLPPPSNNLSTFYMLVAYCYLELPGRSLYFPGILPVLQLLPMVDMCVFACVCVYMYIYMYVLFMYTCIECIYEHIGINSLVLTWLYYIMKKKVLSN